MMLRKVLTWTISRIRFASPCSPTVVSPCPDVHLANDMGILWCELAYDWIG